MLPGISPIPLPFSLRHLPESLLAALVTVTHGPPLPFWLPLSQSHMAPMGMMGYGTGMNGMMSGMNPMMVSVGGREAGERESGRGQCCTFRKAVS